jgi:hypothetical protein
MAKKVRKFNKFNTVKGGGNAVNCKNCDKRITGGYESSNLFRFSNKYFCSLSCANKKGYTESTNFFYKLQNFIMGKGN